MDNRLRSFSYDVKVKPVKMSVEEESKHEHVEDGTVTVSTNVTTSDTIDLKTKSEYVEPGKIKPYGLETDAVYDVEVKEKVEPDVVQEHIDKAVKKATRKKSK